MHARQEVPQGLRRLAERQAGALSGDQVRAAGVGEHVVRRLVREGAWARLARGTYGLGPPTWLQAAWSGLLIGGERAVLGLAAAARLYGFGEESFPIEIYAGRGVERRDPRWRFIDAVRTGWGTPRRTSREQTVLELARTMTEAEAVDLVLRAAVAGNLRPGRLRELATAGPHRHRPLLVSVANDLATGAASPLELRYLWDVERSHDLPVGVRQGSPSRAYRCDVWYEGFNLIVELDGRSYHRGLAAAADLDRDTLHQALGVATVRFTWEQVADYPCRVAARVAGALRAGGWDGRATSCWRCRRSQDGGFSGQ